VEQLQDVANINYNIYRSRIIDLNNKLNEQIMLSAFDVTRLSPKPGTGPVVPSQIEKWRDRVARYISQSPKPKMAMQKRLRESAERYFDKLERLLATGSLSSQSSMFLSAEFQKIRRLVLRLEKFDNECEQAYAPVKSYLDTLNKFFKDSSKQLLFKEDTNQICFQVLNKRDQAVGDFRSVELLSSGERQLLTLFTFIKFSRGGVFIIDEPELSLHPKWQEDFLDAIKTLMPTDAQLILATHSPAIVGKHRNYCITLLPYNE
jgi:predicted ATP-dependent endonuclease of OLD family